jgi:hypothetical protein
MVRVKNYEQRIIQIMFAVTVGIRNYEQRIVQIMFAVTNLTINRFTVTCRV